MDPPTPSSPSAVGPESAEVKDGTGESVSMPNGESPSQGMENEDQPLGSEAAEDPEEEVVLSEENFELSEEEADVPISLPMPDLTEFEVLLPPGLQSTLEEETPSNSGNLLEAPAHVLMSPPRVIHVSELLQPLESGEPGPSFEGVKIVHMGREAGLNGDLQATYWRLPPGTRTSRPFAQRLADSITYCISGRGILWQNGWTFPFQATDCAGWKGGTGITHTIINDSNHDGGPGEDLVLITAHEVKDGDSFFYPLDPEIDEATLQSEGKPLWKDPPIRGEFGSHPGIPSVGAERGNKVIPEPQQGYRPSNVINAIAELDVIGKGELVANATSLSQETGLSTRFGCNFEVPPPGTRSSDPHAHSLEDELVYVVSGSGLVWINGHVQSVHAGDAVGFLGGTGIAHNFINDSNADGAEGDPLVLWIIGHNRAKEGDLVYYPLHIEEKSNSKRWWPDCPKHELGPHNGRPQRPLKT